MKLRSLTIATSVLFAGCMPGRICLTPPYDAPAGFSETYHAALERQAAFGVQTIAPSGGSFVGPPIFVWPTSVRDANPPMEW